MFGAKLKIIRELLLDLVQDSRAYYKLKLLRILASLSILLFKTMLFGVFVLMFIFFCSIAGALALGYALDNFAYGFLIIGLGYLVLIGLIYMFRHRIERGVVGKLSNIFYENKD